MKKFVKILAIVLILCTLSFNFACVSPDGNDQNVNDGGNNSDLTGNEGNESGDDENSKTDDEPTYRTEAEEIEKINENSTFELKFIEDVGNKDLSGFDYHPGFGVCGYTNPKYADADIYTDDVLVWYDVTAYPDYADGGQFVTKIYCSDPEVTFYGGYNLSSGEAFVEELEAAGYNIKIAHRSMGIEYDATKDNIRIIYIPDYRVRFIYQVSNREGIDF